MHDLVSVDPGVEYFAEARWILEDSYRLSSLDWVGVSSLRDVREHFRDRPAKEIVVEGQDMHKGRANTQVVLGLARMAGAVASQAHRADVCLEGTRWKGSVAKDVMSERILSYMTETELALWEAGTRGMLKSNKHDIAHAIGIGLYHIGELHGDRPGAVGLARAKEFGMRTVKRKAA